MATASGSLSRPSFQAFLILRVGFVVAPILFGLDKFFNLTTDWPVYLAPWIERLTPGTAQEFMYAVGVVEIAAGVLVLLSPRWGSLVVAIWLAGIIVNLLTNDPPEFYDVALRDFGLLLAPWPSTVSRPSSERMRRWTRLTSFRGLLDRRARRRTDAQRLGSTTSVLEVRVLAAREALNPFGISFLGDACPTASSSSAEAGDPASPAFPAGGDAGIRTREGAQHPLTA